MEVVLLVVACDHVVRSYVLDLRFLVIPLLAVESAALKHVSVRARTGWDERASLGSA